MLTSETFGEWVRSRRKALDLTREQLASRVGCSVSALRKIEDDQRRPSRQIAELMARGLEIPADYSYDFVKAARGLLSVERLEALSTSSHHPAVLPAPRNAQNSLPVLPTPLIGRQRELAELHKLLSDPQCRMLTLTGPGGIGKTRLAIEVASRLQHNFADGTFFVSLAPVDSSRLLVPVLVHSIGFAFRGSGSADPKAQLLAYLQEKQMLLLVDNMEHLLNEPGTELFGELLARAPAVKVLATSRVPLDLQAEWVFEVGGLPLPEDSSSQSVTQGTAVELFLQRARRAHVGFSATTDDLPAILHICSLLEGMPLAIELAAAWVRTLTCREIAQEVNHGLDFLDSSARDLPARHRSMRAVFDHSWALLRDDERRALARLSVFRGGFEREAAAQVAGASLPMLSSLVAKSLVRRPEMGRYDLHELICQYAALHLEADPTEALAARRQHLEYFLAVAEAAGPQLKSAGQLQCLRRLESEHDNFRAALAWSLSSNLGISGLPINAALQLAGALSWFWEMRAYFDEGRAWLAKALEGDARERSTVSSDPAGSPAAASGELEQRARARALEGLAILNGSAGEHAKAHPLAAQAAAIFRDLGDKLGLADALLTISQVLRWQGHAALSRVRMQEALALYREAGDRWSLARCLFRFGEYLSDFGGDPAGRSMLEESSAILEELGDRYIYVSVLAARAIVAMSSGDYATARSYFDRGLAIARELRDPWGAADALTNIGCILRMQGDYAGARAYLLEALKDYQQGGGGIWSADAYCALGENEIAQGRLSAARSYLQLASSSSESSGNRWLQVLIAYFGGLVAYYDGNMAQATEMLERATALSREGQYLPDLARSLVALGRALHASSDTAQARACISEGLSVFWASGNKLGVATALEALAALTASDNPRRAVQLFGAAASIRSAIGAPLAAVDRPRCEHHISDVRERISEATFADAWARGQVESYITIVPGILASSGA